VKAVVLDGFNEAGDIQSRITAVVTRELGRRGWPAEVIAPRDLDLAPCTGCFGCWTRTPGKCVQKDDAHMLCRAVMASDLMVIISPVTFGGYSSSLKGAMDRVIGLVLPFFTVIRGEVHHKPRYDRIPAMAALGVSLGECQACPALFETLLYRNAVNLYTPSLAVEVAGDKESGNLLEKKVANWLSKVESSVFSGLPERRITRDDFAADPGVRLTPQPSERTGKKALLLSGSPRKRSTSSVLGDELSVYLRERDWQTDRIRILPSLRDREKRARLTEALDEADLVVLLSPLYVDSFPAPVTEALESVAESRRKDPPHKNQGFMAVLNCGFPEASQNYTALAIARQFALETGFTWLGGLALGMGGAINGESLGHRGAMARNVRKALGLVAAAFDRGEPVPPEAADRMGRPHLPRWLYLALGNWNFKRQARKNGAIGRILARPYQT